MMYIVRKTALTVFKGLTHNRNFCTRNVFSAQKLEERSLIRISGADVHGYVQGLITNDMRHLEEGASSIYALFLNTKGRVLYDSIIYKTKDPDTLILDCDKNVVSELKRHLNLYKVRRKMSIDICDDELVQWALSENLKDWIVQLNEQTGLIFHQDPRGVLGYRAYLPKDFELVESLRDYNTVEENKFYDKLRYSLGVGEGITDLPPGNCFPLECNCDYLHGISFHKGCYIGQELTARTHHTGVIRKRLMPIYLEEPIQLPSPDFSVSVKESKRPLGKIRSIQNQYGIGLMRIKEALETDFFINGVRGKTLKPNWWPSEAPKERQNVQKEWLVKMLDEADNPKKEERGIFQCSCCFLNEEYDYKGKNPSFLDDISVKCGGYIIANPFYPPTSNKFILLGQDCVSCKKPVCQSSSCSIYHDGRYCKYCATGSVDSFPTNVRRKIDALMK